MIRYLWIFLLAGLLCGATNAQKVCGVIRQFNNLLETWDFSSFVGKPVVAVVQRQEFGYSDNVTWSYQFSFCDKVQTIVDTDITKETDQRKWLGWNHGKMERFVYVGLNPQISTDKEDVTVKRHSQSLTKTFEQDFQYGDQGYPCLQGRFASVFIYCGANGDTCRGIPNVGQDNCLDGTTPTSQVPCICDVIHDPEFHPCSVNISVLLIGCPNVHVENGPLPSPPNPGLSGGQVFGIILLILFLLALVMYVGGFIYNYKVKNLRGVDAIPFISVCRGRSGSEYTPAPSSSSYGSVDK